MNSLTELDEPEPQIEEDDESKYVPLLEKKPSLPSWILDADKALDQFKQSYDHFKREHGQLTTKLNQFNEKEKKARQEYLMRKYFPQQLEEEARRKQVKKANLDDLPKYVLLLIARFISRDYGPHLIKLSRVSSSFYKKLKDSSVWCTLIRDYLGLQYVSENQRNIASYDAEQKEALKRLNKMNNVLKEENKPVMPKHPFMSNMMPKAVEKKEIKKITTLEESYWEVIFKNFYSKLALMKSTLRTLYDSKFPKNNNFNLLNKEINGSLNFIIEIFSTVGTYEYNPNLRIMQIIKDVVMEESSLLALIRLGHSENGVIRINSLTVLFSLVGYFNDLKQNFLKYASITSVKHIEDSIKEFNINTFAINMSGLPICIVPDITGFKVYNRTVVSKNLHCNAKINFTNSFPATLPIKNSYVKWDGVFLTVKGEIIEEGELNIKFIEETKEIEGNLITLKKIGEDDYESVWNTVQGTYRPEVLKRRLDAMKTDHSLKTFREVFATIYIIRANNQKDEYNLGLDIAISTKKEGWFACLHGLSIDNTIFFCYTPMKEN